MDWSFNSFDQVGEYNTLRSVWAKLRDGRRVKGKKRSAEDHDSYSNIYENSPKKTKVSLNVSSACERLESILLQDGEAGNSMNVSVDDDVFERVEDEETSNEWDIRTNETCRKSSGYPKQDTNNAPRKTSGTQKQATEATSWKTSGKPKQTTVPRMCSQEPNQIVSNDDVEITLSSPVNPGSGTDEHLS